MKIWNTALKVSKKILDVIENLFLISNESPDMVLLKDVILADNPNPH